MSTDGNGTVPVRPETLAFIRIKDGQVFVNGDEIPHDGSTDLYQLGIHAAAQRVAARLSPPGPVRAEAIDATSRTALVVHPDGTASDFVVLEEYPSTATEEQAVDAVVLPLIAPSDPPNAAPMPASSSVVASSRPRLPLVAAVVGAVALVAVIGAGAVAVSRGAEDPAEASQVDATTSPAPSQALTPVAPSDTPTSQPALPTAAASAVGGRLALVVKVRTSTVPGRITVKVEQTGRKPVRRSVVTRKQQSVVRITGLKPGAARWSVRVASTGTAALVSEPVTGKTVVKAPKTPPRSSAPTSSPPPATSTPSPPPATSTPPKNTTPTQPKGPKGRDTKTPPPRGPIER
ncbi:hypothetical protein ACLM5J_19665 [Nocardioides sp. Bht2]|uniref:hypothetical protein n=1 Tax=Nocardioides sp. Bht2 TaxID=3392297 RepID=UPI0039B52385